MSDPHVLGEGLAPTPFTAEEIRRGCPDGHELRIRTTEGGATSLRASRFEDGDAEGATIVSGPVDEAGAWLGEPVRARATWAQLQAHAAFPADRTTIAAERVALSIGERDCLCYAVRGEEGVSTFWFALAHPGMPLRYGSGDALVEVVAIR
ncbi:hypothetical protein OVA14_04890 [Agrococcus sp. SL85]|uniref:hypothetical protein n=1 Tax=Agrococcus sp. SL85 TaxID=2995141 RepID=UPI00226D3323|nr:hypothetical protein [Agrococcus sp. SL85]WAC67090.1 hypothetical protein OVA14_04890 [Agrococcus sp. SL85]